MRNKKILNMVLCALFAALIAIGAFIKIPVPYVPFTLQLEFTMLAGLLLGPELGALSVALYVVMGLLGVPVFAEGGGFAYVFKPSFGYLIGFIIGTYVTGYIANKVKKPSFKRVLVASLAGLLIVYLVGMIYFYIIKNFYLAAPIGVWSVILYCFILVVPGDLLLCIIGSYIGKRLIPIIGKETRK
ncbi:MAG: biotin transporter BioY [Clostridia bacterium]|nr:biotin transporter BioY [Clostridia bacterium]